MRPKTGILVSVLDFGDLEDKILVEVLENLEKKLNLKSEMSSVRNLTVWGLVETHEGMYVINCLGQGPNTPLTKQQTTNFVFEFHAVFGEEHEFILVETPLYVMPITRDVCLEMGISHTMYLEDFIVRHVPAIEENFNWWLSKLTPIVDKPEKDDEDEKEPLKQDLSKYGPFLVNTKCDCSTNKAPLVRVEGNYCPCGKPGKHTHCRKCGKVM